MPEILPSEEPIHAWFELSYAQYLTIPRSALQSMPIEWQHRFVECLMELDEIDWRPQHGTRYRCQLYFVDDLASADDFGTEEQYVKAYWRRAIEDPLGDYARGRRRLPRRAR